MLRQNQISEVIDVQDSNLAPQKGEVIREQLPKIKNIPEYASIITGMRRVGKSTLLRQIANTLHYTSPLYLNFDDIRLSAFEKDDFTRLYNELVARGSRQLFFDEIQLVKGWEIFIHQLLREGYTIYISGSNASLLSVDLGTHLTGRHLQNELFPFSFTEFLSLKKLPATSATFQQYLQMGGIPEYLKTETPQLLSTLLDDILIRDIAVNKGVTNVKSLRQLALYLLTNIGRPYSAKRLTAICNVASPTTVIDYISYMRDAYLLDSIELFSDSIQVRARNPKKVYAYDTGLVNILSLSRTPDMGRLLENFVFISLRQKYQTNHIFYWQNAQHECDFVLTDQANHPQMLVQVCYEIDDNNFNREIDGLTHAMTFFGLNEGYILTFNEEDEFHTPAGTIYTKKALDWVAGH